MLGTARPTLETEIVANAPRPVWPSARPIGSETAIASPIATAVTFRCVHSSGSSSAPPTRAPPACDSREWKMKSKASPKSPRKASVVLMPALASTG